MSEGYKRPAVAGSGTIACGLAASASALGEVRLLARSEASAQRALEQVGKLAGKVEGADAGRVSATADPSELAECDLAVEAIVEQLEPKVELLRELAEVCPEADLASTTSSLPIGEMGRRIGQPERFFGLHVFNPVPQMKLIELCFPEGVPEGVAERARAWCEALGKTPIVVPDQSCFVVGRLLFPYLFDAVRLMERTGMDPADIDTCMKLGAGHPMGPLQLLDFVGLDVSKAIGESLHAELGEQRVVVPETIERLVSEGKLGRKSGEGFHSYAR